MVKRPKSPEIVEESRYFTVYKPYPIHANWIMEDDQKKCAMWVAECIGLHHLWAIYYKPKARGMILLEVARSFTDHGRFLGEHRLGEVLRNPDELEKDSVTQVFHSFYQRAREAQKDGWKVIPVPNIWFQGWLLGQSIFVHPYPDTHWCPLPPEDRTNKHICRPIPSDQKPPPPVPRKQLVPGSAKWVNKHVMSPTTPSTTNAWAKPIPILDIPKAINQRGPSPSSSTPQSAISGNDNKTPTTTTETKFPAATSKTRGKPIPLNEFISGPPKSKKSGWGKTADTTDKFSLKDPVVRAPVNAWSKKLNIPPSEKPAKRTPTTEDMDYSGWNLPDPPSKTTSSTASPAPGETRLQPDPDKVSKKLAKSEAKTKKAEEAWSKIVATSLSASRETEAEGEGEGGETNGEMLVSAPPVPDEIKPLTKADVDRVLRPWERGKVDYAAMGVVDAEPPGPITVKGQWDSMDWTPQHVLDEAAKGMKEAKSKGRDKGKGKEKERTSEHYKKRKPDGQFDSKGKAKYSADGNPDNKDDSRKRASPGPMNAWGEQADQEEEKPKEEKKKRFRGRDRDPEWVAANPFGSGERRAPGKALARVAKHGVVWHSRRKAEGEEGESVGSGGGSELGQGGSADSGMNDWATPREGEAGPSDWAGEPEIKEEQQQGYVDWSEEFAEEPPASDGAYEEGQDEEPNWADEWTHDPNDTTVHKEVSTPEPSTPKVKKEEKEIEFDWSEKPFDYEVEAAAWGYVPDDPPAVKQEEEEVELDWAGNPKVTDDDYAAWGVEKPHKVTDEDYAAWGVEKPDEDEDEAARNPSIDKEAAAAWGYDPNELLPANDDNTHTDWDTAGAEPYRRWKKEEELICPTHNIACKKGICRDISKLIRDRNLKQWERTRGRGKGHPNTGRLDPRGPRGSWGAKELPNGEIVTYKRTRRGRKKDPNTIGVMRGFQDEETTATEGGTGTATNESNDDNGDD